MNRYQIDTEKDGVKQDFEVRARSEDEARALAKQQLEPYEHIVKITLTRSGEVPHDLSQGTSEA